MTRCVSFSVQSRTLARFLATSLCPTWVPRISNAGAVLTSRFSGSSKIPFSTVICLSNSPTAYRHPRWSTPAARIKFTGPTFFSRNPSAPGSRLVKGGMLRFFSQTFNSLCVAGIPIKMSNRSPVSDSGMVFLSSRTSSIPASLSRSDNKPAIFSSMVLACGEG